MTLVPQGSLRSFEAKAINDAQQIADGIGVLVAVQPVSGDAPGIGRGVAIHFLQLRLNEADQGRDVVGGRTRNAFGRHLAVADLSQNHVPLVAMLGDGFGGCVRQNIQPAGRELVIVTRGAGVDENRLNCFLEGYRRRRS